MGERQAYKNWKNIDLVKIAGSFNQLDGNIFLGIDGFVDEVWQIVETRKDIKNREVFKEMGKFAKAVLDCGKGGFSHEIVKKRRSYGGFTANTGQAVGRLGGNPTMVGLFGKDRIEEAYKPFADLYEIISVGNPALCSIYEFEDGKIMLPYIEEIMGLNWERLTKAASEQTLKALLDKCSVIALGYWSLTPAFDEIAANVCRLLGDGAGKRMFFDFADIRKKDGASLDKTLKLLAEFNGSPPMTLSLNEHEASLLFARLKVKFSVSGENLWLDIEDIRKRIGLDEIIVHTPHWAAGANSKEGGAFAEQVYCEKPVITAGAGDNFNAGFLTASLTGLTLPEKLAAANAVARFYLANGHSPDRKELAEEMGRMYESLHGNSSQFARI
ncbi:MAG: carbohydrate kinase family protein [Clostridiales bacterium]|jgi:sugar/nucleoside kinase (ribokinase family)|nr:carbohydrate kinase family protein [Clostridiales bacterium]